MRVEMLTSPGRDGRPNEDFAGAVPGAAVLLDGAGIPGTEAVCRHGVAWYTHRLGGALLGRLLRDGGRDLATILAEGIDEVTDAHRDTCHPADPAGPQATVAMIRVDGGRLDYLLLADAYLLLDRAGASPRVVTDVREVTARRACAAPLDGVPAGTPEYDRVYARCVEALRARRNQPGGYWLAKDDPHAAAEAVTGDLPVRGVPDVALLSNGAARLVDPYGLLDWAGVRDVLRSEGPAGVVRRVRRAEESGAGAAPDDATVVRCTDLAG
ncbi:hypothetical protein O7598_15215 [Micromonospora sp. WMMC241]|uniref:hypothetical protein n=1 Tax=Micromonospora sp. WMMC241 TaxID=3015159 RepID=UPI0022B74B1F|nr:hypothetical protein [Micromonospora sp. WMMC241]MCZ7437756.1 hypothetical protein [Micromonospora sp. WMMC241]